MAARVAITAITASGLMAQIIPPVLPSESFTWAEHITLTTAMVIAIAVLWRALQVKDAAQMDNAKVTTEALAESAASNRELRKIIEDSVSAKRQLSESIDMLRMEMHQERIRQDGDTR